MSSLNDARNNEFQGAVDQIGGQSITDARTASATINALNGEIAMDLVGKATAMFDLRGTTSATYVFEASLDGANYYALAGVLLAGTINGAAVTQQDASSLVLSGVNACLVEVQAAGFRRIRARCSSFTSGSAVVTARASAAPFQLGVPSLDTAEAVMNLVASQVFIDTFNAVLDTVDNWNTPLTGSSGVAFAFSGASITGGTGTTANGFSVITSRNSFQPGNPGYLEIQRNIGIPDLASPIANAYRFWGIGTATGTPTTAAPLTNALGFELGTNGKMAVVCWQSGARVLIQDLSASTGNGKQPTAANGLKYYMWIRGDIGFFAIEGRDKTHVVATFLSGALGPDITTLPLISLCVGGPTPPASNAQLVDNMTCVGDTAQSNLTISDGQFPFRVATVKGASAAAVATDGALVVAISPNTPTRIQGNAGAAVDGAIAAAPPANALQIGIKAATANPTNATAGNQVAIMGDKAGRPVCTPVQARDLVGVQTTTIAASAAETTIVTAGAAGVFNDLTALIITMGTTPTACTATLKDATAGTTRAVVDLPGTTGQGLVLPLYVPMAQAAAANNWTLTLSSAAPTVHVTALFAKNT